MREKALVFSVENYSDVKAVLELDAYAKGKNFQAKLSKK